MTKVYAFTGRMFSGKDAVIDWTGLRQFSLADPIYDIVKHLYGTCDKSVPGTRHHMQQIGRWGRGHCLPGEQEEFQSTCEAIRQTKDAVFHPRWTGVNWEDFGQSDGKFWIHILEDRLRTEQDRVLVCAINSVRWENELQWLADRKYTHVHVTCSDETRHKRMSSTSYRPTQAELDDVSEQLAFKLDVTAGLRVWNDTGTKKDHLTVREFLSTL